MILNLENKYNILFPNGEIKTLTLKNILGENKTILYFYPRDNTPGCTIENKDFTEFQNEFNKFGYYLVGVSKDSVNSHKNFIEKYGLKNPLISDTNLILHKELGVWGEKKNYGKAIIGVIRSTFIINNSGKVLKEYRNIRAKGHVQRILKEIKDS